MRTISFLSKFMIGFVTAGSFKWTDDIDQNLIKKYSSQRPYMVVKYTIDGEEKTKKLIFDLFWTKKPKTALNFAMLIEGFADSNNNAYKYKNTKFHRIVKDFVLQGGDITNGNGTGGYSIYGKNFPYENGAVNHALGSLSMANAGRDTNSSQFFICLKELSYLKIRTILFLVELRQKLMDWKLLKKLQQLM